jgi:Protein of unknown function (DUF3662)/FHA domain
VSVLRSIENRIESLFEGVFGRAFRSHVQPVELARKLAKEMDEHKTISVSRVYVPNEYLLYLSPADREQFRGYEDSLLTELADYLAEHARREGYALLSTPRVVMDEDDELELGEFGIAARMVQPRQAVPPPGAPAAEAFAQGDPGATRVYRPSEAAAPAPQPDGGGPAMLAVAGRKHELGKPQIVLGRSRECDITISDPNVSRRHAEIRHENGSYWIVDLNSTNGVEVNGKRIDRARLEHSDRIVLGQTELTFEQA